MLHLPKRCKTIDIFYLNDVFVYFAIYPEFGVGICLSSKRLIFEDCDF